MSKKKSILVATIGTRDLAFCVSSNEWMNLGNSHVSDSDSISEQAMIQMDLGLEKTDFRFLTKYLSDRWEQYKDRIKPIILGKLLNDESKNIRKIYLVATDQPESVRERDKDTLHSAEIIKKWIQAHHGIDTKIIFQGPEGENPANFEAMFRWWKQVWQGIALSLKENTEILLCVKGGVGALSEAGRVTALSRFGENIQFFDFKKDDCENRLGNPSNYTVPLKGTNYLWDRRQQEALALLQRYDYEAVQKILKSYLKNPDEDWQGNQLIVRVQLLLEAGVKWNQAEFAEFAKILEGAATTRSHQWWWTGYEAAYLATVRYQQGNTVEAMFHSFRAVEGLMSEWAIHTFPSAVERRDHPDDKSKNEVPLVKESIRSYPGLESYAADREGKFEIYLYGKYLSNLVRLGKPEHQNCSDIQKFWSTTNKWRNSLFHRLLGLDKSELFSAWDAANLREWENRVLGCLNFLSDQNFTSLAEASLMHQVHIELKEAINTYQP